MGFKDNEISEEELRNMFIVTQKNGVKIKAKTFKEGGNFYIKIYPDSE